MRKKERPAIRARVWFLIIAGLVLCLAGNTQYFSEKEEGIWEASGVKVFNCEYVSFADHRPDGIAIRLTNTPFLRTTYFQMGAEASKAKMWAYADVFSVQRYTKGEKGSFILSGSEKVMRAETDSDYYSPLLSGENGKSGSRLYTDFGVYEIS